MHRHWTLRAVGAAGGDARVTLSICHCGLHVIATRFALVLELPRDYPLATVDIHVIATWLASCPSCLAWCGCQAELKV